MVPEYKQDPNICNPDYKQDNPLLIWTMSAKVKFTSVFVIHFLVGHDNFIQFLPIDVNIFVFVGQSGDESLRGAPG